MPQARTSGSSTRSAASKSAAAKPAAAKPAAAKSTAAKPAATKPAAAKPAAKSTASRAAASKAAAKPAAAKPAATKPAGRAGTAAKSSAAKPAAKSAAANGGSKTAGAAKGRSRVGIHVNAESTQAQVEAIAERVRKLNEKIIDLGREAGENTLTSYEKALKTIATGIAQSPAKDEIEWITHLAASQAKFVREITDSWAKAARDRLK
jgi:hypothetical protein